MRAFAASRYNGYRPPDSRCTAHGQVRSGETRPVIAGSRLLSAAVEACGRHGPCLHPAACGRARRPPCAQGALSGSNNRSIAIPGPRRQRQRSPPEP
eukprot:scaffold78983_cov75-Phaeocystis_antarctica.AAC.5